MTAHKLSLTARSPEDLQTLKSAVALAFGLNTQKTKFAPDQAVVYRSYNDPGVASAYAPHEFITGFAKAGPHEMHKAQHQSAIRVDVKDHAELTSKMNAAIANLPANYHESSKAAGSMISMGRAIKEDSTDYTAQSAPSVGNGPKAHQIAAVAAPSV